jgi:hypothetical protein
VSHVMLAIKEHLVCGANTHCFGHAQKLSLEANHDYLSMSSPGITFPCRERKPITRVVNFLLTSDSMQLKSYSLGEACLNVSLPG